MPRGARLLLVLALSAAAGAVVRAQDTFIPILDEEDAAVERALGPSGLDPLPVEPSGAGALGSGGSDGFSPEEGGAGVTGWSDLNAPRDLAAWGGASPVSLGRGGEVARYLAGQEGLDSTLLVLLAGGRYRLDWKEIIGDVQTGGSNQGTCRLASSSLDVTPALGGRAPRYRRNATRRYVEVRWGERRYLVPDDPLVFLDFCNAVNAGDEPRTEPWGRHLLRWGDWSLPARGAPALPPRHRVHLLRTPLRARVLALKDRGGRSVRALREGGRARLALNQGDGVRQYHTFYLPGSFAYLVVTQVRQRDALADVHPGRQGPWDPRAVKPLAVGAVVTTRRPPPPAAADFDDGIDRPDDPW